ncbi:MAG: molybdopterin molybdotransferase MoeA [Saprospiraceae bacterium]
MITVNEALDIINKHQKDFGTELIPLANAIGRVLKEDLYTDRQLPPYDRVTMDGIAIQYAHFSNGKRAFPIAGIAPAGAAQLTLEKEGHCLEVMTGSIMPNKVDTVIRYEDIVIENGIATIQVDTLKEGQNIHWQGSDRKKGDLIVPYESVISPAEVGVAATVGKTHLKVARLPKAIIISTGDELVEIEEMPLPYQIRKSNVHRLRATLAKYNIIADRHHLDDDMEVIKKDLAKIINQYEVVILSGGVSKGKFDFLPEALAALGVRKLFHKIKQRPGKPFWFGQAPNGTLVFALPGNPVSSFLCTQRYFVTWLTTSLGLPKITVPHGILTRDTTFKPDLTYFLQVKVTYNEHGQILATPVDGNGSGDLANLVDADAFLQLPRGKDLFEKGAIYPLLFYR